MEHQQHIDFTYDLFSTPQRDAKKEKNIVPEKFEKNEKNWKNRKFEFNPFHHSEVSQNHKHESVATLDHHQRKGFFSAPEKEPIHARSMSSDMEPPSRRNKSFSLGKEVATELLFHTLVLA